MNQQDNIETNDQSIIEDLSAQNADEIKGGPTPKSKRVIVLQSSVAEGQADEDNTLQGWSLNHNETVVADEDEEAATTAPLADLEVSDEQAEQAKGGPTKRMWDYIRGV